MSSVRMCDKCKVIFSENDEGWTTLAGARRVRNERDGGYRQEQTAIDFCSTCSGSMTGGTTPKVPAVEGRYDPRYTQQLEKETGIGKE
jgi:ribosomal protein L37AE/L43A